MRRWPPASGVAWRFDLRIEVPERNDRFGTHRGITLLGGALPVLAVLDEGGWHLDSYVDLGESFYSLVATYRVALDVPGSLATATTGVLDATSHHGDRERRVYRASDVRDFAIAAGALRRVVGHAGGTRIVVWYHPDVTSAATAERVLGDARASMRTFSAGFGAYPYPEVDVVASAFTTFGGMEYPQIVFSNPDRYTVAHELAHQWWWGIVGNDEFAEPWLDESLATWSMYLPYAPWRNCGTFDWPSPSATAHERHGLLARPSRRLRHDLRWRRVHVRRPGARDRRRASRPGARRLRGRPLARRDHGGGPAEASWMRPRPTRLPISTWPRSGTGWRAA